MPISSLFMYQLVKFSLETATDGSCKPRLELRLIIMIITRSRGNNNQISVEGPAVANMLSLT